MSYRYSYNGGYQPSHAPPQQGSHYPSAPPQGQFATQPNLYAPPPGRPHSAQYPPQGWNPPPPYNGGNVVPQGYYQGYAPPPGPPPSQTYQHGAPPPRSPGRSGFRPPQTGFTKLPQRFHVWNRLSSGGEAYMEMGAQPLGEPAYSLKLGLSSRTKFKEGKYQAQVPAIAVARSKSTFSSKSILEFNGHEAQFSALNFKHGSKNPIELPVNGRTEVFEWQASAKPGFVDRLKSNTDRPKSWRLVPQGAPENVQPFATWTDSGGSALKDKSEFGVFEFHGRGLTGEMGDVSMAFAIMSILRIIHQHFQREVAKAVGSAG